MNIANFILFQTAWFVTIFSAASDKPYIGVLFTILWMLFHLSVVASKRKSELMLIASAVLIAAIFESTLLISGFISYPEHAVLFTLVPLWMITLWINLALTINHSMSWLKGRYVLSASLAAIAGPLTYAAGERFDAIILHGMPSLIAISIIWLFAMPLLFWLSHLLTNINLVNSRLVVNRTE